MPPCGIQLHTCLQQAAVPALFRALREKSSSCFDGIVTKLPRLATPKDLTFAQIQHTKMSNMCV